MHNRDDASISTKTMVRRRLSISAPKMGFGLRVNSNQAFRPAKLLTESTMKAGTRNNGQQPSDVPAFVEWADWLLKQLPTEHCGHPACYCCQTSSAVRLNDRLHGYRGKQKVAGMVLFEEELARRHPRHRTAPVQVVVL